MSEDVFIRIETSDRTDVGSYFSKSDLRTCKKLSHHPLLLFDVKGASVKIRILDCADQLLNYPDDRKVMGQWGGQWSSDFFKFTVGQFRKYVEDHPRAPHEIV